MVQHTPPGSELPDLSSAHAPSPDDPSLTRSRNCFSDPCVVDDWDTPLDAVRAALTVNRLYGEYVTSPAIGASTEWILNYPAQRYLDDPDAIVARVSIQPRNPAELPILCIPEPLPDIEEDVWCAWTFSVNHDWVTNSVDVGFATGHRPGSGQPPEHWPSAILHLDNKFLNSDLPHDDSVPTAGIAMVHFSANMHDFFDVSLTNPYSNRDYRGRPVIGLVLQEYSNAQLVDSEGNNLVARYGNVFDAGRILMGWD